jgi:hypothetical protein
MVRKWLQTAIDHDYLPVIASLKPTTAGRRLAQELNQRIRQDWHEHGATALSQKQGLSDELRRYLKDKLGEGHWVLDYVGLTTEEYAEINDRKQGRVAERNEATQQIEDPDAIVSRAVELIVGQHDWAEIAAGLAVLTGRRVAEILSTAQFEKKSQWSVTFTGALKRRGEVGLRFEIPTLTTADRVIGAMERLRAELPEAVGMDAKAINRKYEQAVARACDRAFRGLVPTREGKDSLYTHLFRAVYATIATFWYCPPSVHETEFRAAIQGHYAILDAKSFELRRSLAASRHYADYEIADQQIANYHGKRKGIKLGVGGVQPIQVFRAAWEQGSEPRLLPARKIRSSYRIWHDDKLRLDRILEPFKSAGTHQQDRFHAFLNWFEEQQHRFSLPQAVTPEATEPEPTAFVESEAIHIPIQSQALTMQQSTDKHETEPTPIGSPTDNKIDRLIETMEKFIDMQMALASAQSAPTAPTAPPTKQPRIARPKIAFATTDVSTPLTEADGAGTSLTEKSDCTPQTRAGAAVTTERINRAIDTMMAYNDAPTRRHDEKWAIGINTLKAFVKSQEAIVAAIGGRNRKGEDVVGTRQAEIQSHHQKHQIDPDKHNYKHRGKTRIEALITLD